MPNTPIDLRQLRRELKGGLDVDNELSEPEEPLLLMDEEQAHGGADDEDESDADTEGLLAWEAPESEDHAAGPLLRLGGGALLVLGGAVTIFFGSALFAILLLIGGGLIIASAFRSSRGVSCAITPRGLILAKRLYGFDDLESFWIHYDPPLFREVSIRSRKTFLPILRLPLGETDPLRVREVLLRFLPEERHEPGLLDIVSRIFGF